MATNILLSHLLNFLAKKNRRTLNSKESGFTLIEVLVTILVVTGFILGSLQAVVLANLFRVQAQDKNEVTNWVQQDLELIRYQAFMLPEDEDECGDYGSALQDQLTAITNPVEINNKDYTVTRSYTPDGNKLGVTHVVTYGANHPRNNSTNDELTTLSTEIIPDAAFSCP